MTHWYSPSSGAFGLQIWGKKKRPADAIDVSAEEHAALFPMDEPQREIEAGPDGKPRWKVTSIDVRRQSAIRSVKREAARRIDAVMPMFKQINALRSGKDTDVRFTQIDAIRSASDLIELDLMESENPQDVPVNDHPLWPED
jgi:hypothetical protein